MIVAQAAWALGGGVLVAFTAVYLVELVREWRKPWSEEPASDEQRAAEGLRPAAVEAARKASRAARECDCELHDTIASLAWVFVAQLDAIIEDDLPRLTVLLERGSILQAKLDGLVKPQAPEPGPRITFITEGHLQRIAAARFN